MRKQENRKPKHWEMIGDTYYPYIQVSIDPKITTIVGANESGKSHLLSAIEKAISGKDIERSDFCGYSPFFTVKQNELKYPDFGSEWADLKKPEQDSLRKIIPEIHRNTIIENFFIFRNNVDSLTIYLPEKGEYTPYPINEKQVIELYKLLPRTFRIESSIALPSSVPIKKLVQLSQENYLGGRKFELLDREQRNKIVDALDVFSDNQELITKVRVLWGENREEIDSEAVTAIKSIMSALDEVNFRGQNKERRENGFNLAYKLICKIGQVDANALLDLAKAIQDGMQGYANGIIERINRQLAINLNFPNYWVQDRKFGLKVMARDYDLVFTITDRTGTEYSFDERSQGLQYFLSYYIEYRSHEPHPNKTEILLMDEPDAYLSSQAQQDLLRIFDLFASPEPGSHLTHPIQVVYVTHSPFLIDKNHSERIRVLQKGNEDEGTRVVKDFAINRYEPLRSSIGPHIGETVFIGNCNLMVEGIGDQIIIAGSAIYLRANGVSNLETLDLNQITIVDSGGASQIPYMVYLACGRHADEIAAIVLLDSDKSGNDAKKDLLGKGGQHRRPLLKEKFILQLADLQEEFYFESDNITAQIEIEDIIPLPISIQATKLYLQEFILLEETELLFLTEDLISSNMLGKTILDVIEQTLKSVFAQDLKISKAGFARNVIRVVNEWSGKRNLLNEREIHALRIFEQNFKILFKKLNIMQRIAQQILTKERLSQKIDRLKKDFIARHPISARREDGVILFDEIEGILESNIQNESIKEIEATKNQIQNLRRDYKLDIDMNKMIDDYTGFQVGLERIKYAGLLASQEKTPDEAEAENSAISEEVLEEVQTDKFIVDGQAQLVNEQEIPTVSDQKTTEVSGNPPTSNKRRKSNPR
ncbi:AAA family ATPase [Nostoc sp.]|uniref:AAA family ATPase n=1 Tax=Nostoc sp. TaxID=1180 RepID=UPI002FF840E0